MCSARIDVNRASCTTWLARSRSPITREAQAHHQPTHKPPSCHNIVHDTEVRSFVLLLGQYHCEDGLGEWVEFTRDQRFLYPTVPSLVFKARAPIMPKAMLADPSNDAALQ